MILVYAKAECVPRGAVPWVPSSIAQRGNGIGETPEEGGKLALSCFELFE